MSGYLEVKYPFKSNLPLNPFKSWKRQWCILRPCPHRAGAGALAVYSSEAGAAAGSVDLPPGCVVRRAHSRTRPYAFAVFGPHEPRKPRLLLAGHTLYDTQLWMDKIQALLNETILLSGNIILKDSFSVSIMSTEFSYKLGLIDAGAVLCVSLKGVSITQPSTNADVLIPWLEILNVTLKGDTLSDNNRVCVIVVNSGGDIACPELAVRGPSTGEVARALRRALADSRNALARVRPPAPRRATLSRSCEDVTDAEQHHATAQPADLQRSELGGARRRRSWDDGPSEVSLDDTDLVISKESTSFPSRQLSRCTGGMLAPSMAAPVPPIDPRLLRGCHSADSLNESACERRSLLSLSSGVYEEILDSPAGPAAPAPAPCEEPTYESVAECAFATLRPHRRALPPPPPPPLPPRHPYGTLKASDSWREMCGGGSGHEVTRHSSLGSLPHSCIAGAAASRSRTLPKPDKTKPFDMFRKRLKSDSRLPSATAKGEQAHTPRDLRPPVENKKKRFDFAPPRDIFKNFRVSRGLMKNLKISSGNLAKIGETKSCEFLDESEHAAPHAAGRCAKSVECLDAGAGASAPAARPHTPERPPHTELSLPDDIVELILRGRDVVAQLRLRQRQLPEDEYVPVSPAGLAPPPDHHYVAMSPRTDLAAP